MKKETFNLVIRFMVGLAVSLLLCAGMIMTGKLGSSKPLIQQTSGLKGDEVIMTVDGENVEAWEYLYMAGNSAQNLAYYGITDLSMALSEDYTAADYVAAQAESRVVQQASIRKWAADLGITLTDEDQASLQAQKEAYGDELELILKLNGLTEAQYDQMMDTTLLYDHIYDAYCGEGGAQRPDDAALLAEAEEHGLMSADVLSVNVSAMDETEKAEVKALLEQYSSQLAAAEDKITAFAQLEVDARITAAANVTYDGCEETVLNTALAALGENELTGVVEDEGVYYVALRRAIDLDSVAAVVFSEEATTRMTNAQVTYVDSVYGSVDLAAYYTRFSALQQTLYTQLVPAEN